MAKIFHTSLSATALRVVELSLWDCQIVWCRPTKQHGGGYAVELRGVMTTSTLKHPPFVRSDHYSRLAVAEILDAFTAKKLVHGCLTEHQWSSKRRRWRLECSPAVYKGESCILVLVIPEASIIEDSK